EGERVIAGGSAVAAPTYTLGLIGLRVTKIARIAVAVGSLSLVYVCAAPLIRAAYMPPPPRVHALHELSVASLRFPALRVPAVPPKGRHVKAAAPPLVFKAPTVAHKHATQATQAIAPATQPLSKPATRTRTIRLPVVKDNRDMTPGLPPASTSSSSSSAATAGAPTPPVVTSSAGLEPSSLNDGAAATAAGAPPIVSSNVGVDPASFNDASTSAAAATATTTPAAADNPDTSAAAAVVGMDGTDAAAAT